MAGWNRVALLCQCGGHPYGVDVNGVSVSGCIATDAGSTRESCSPVVKDGGCLYSADSWMLFSLVVL